MKILNLFEFPHALAA